MQLKILSICFVLVLLTIGVFGSFVLGSMDYTANHACPISVSSGNNCPILNSLSLAIHHLSGLQNLSQSTININFSAFILLGISAIFFLMEISSGQIQSSLPLSYQRHQEFLNFTIKPKKKFLRWLAIFNKKDPHLLRWVYEACLTRNLSFARQSD